MDQITLTKDETSRVIEALDWALADQNRTLDTREETQLNRSLREAMAIVRPKAVMLFAGNGNGGK